MTQIYKNEQFNEVIEQMSNLMGENQELKGYVQQQGMATAMQEKRQDLIRFQLELDRLADKIKHLLASDILLIRDDGTKHWVKETNPNEIIMNEHGVKQIMKIITPYLDKNIIMSNHSEERIEGIVYDFAHNLNKLFYCCYDLWGLGHPERIRYYNIYLEFIVNIIYAVYRRSVGGEEKKEMATARFVSGSDREPSMNNPMMMPKQRSILNPMRYLKGAY